MYWWFHNLAELRILGSVGTKHRWRSGDWLTVRHVSVASQNRRLTASSTAAHYIDHHPKMASSKLGHWPEHGSNRLSYRSNTMIHERKRIRSMDSLTPKTRKDAKLNHLWRIWRKLYPFQWNDSHLGFLQMPKSVATYDGSHIGIWLPILS